MTRTQLQNDIRNIVTGIEVQEAVDLVVAYIRKTQQFDSAAEAQSWWNMQSDDDKINVLKKALEG